ncbi:IS66 family insertion sequence element accessory protein TnpB [Neorhizobium galegae]|uniref:IS66 family insertion sequence element accessory protein TnpB n=1 Tax=Neorhizobium galegae TaxID=399 RepID=A0A6A1THY9_NEOGA|nr:IS66 family insertion sequence element accessory protein TnpB [Neorhizobium galegae]
MIASGVVVYVSCQPVDFRKGAASLMALVRDGGLYPFNSALYVFRSKRKDRVRIVWWDGSGGTCCRDQILYEITPPLGFFIQHAGILDGQVQSSG